VSESVAGGAGFDDGAVVGEAVGCKRPAIWRGVCERPRSPSTRARRTGSAAALPGCGRARRRCARQSAVTILYPRVTVVLRRTSRDTTDAHRSMCAAIARIDYPAFSPEAISTRSPTVNILRTHNPLLDHHRCYDAMTPPLERVRWSQRGSSRRQDLAVVHEERAWCMKGRAGERRAHRPAV